SFLRHSLNSFRFTIGLNTHIVTRLECFCYDGITFDAHPHSGCGLFVSHLRSETDLKSQNKETKSQWLGFFIFSFPIFKFIPNSA
ncbi:hypothetical protein, partial [Streptococcus salivarius]